MGDGPPNFGTWIINLNQVSIMWQFHGDRLRELRDFALKKEKEITSAVKHKIAVYYHTGWPDCS